MPVSKSFYDFFADYVAPPRRNIVFGCRVTTIDYTSTPTRLQCQDGRTFTSNYTIVTVPLQILNDHDIDFVPKEEITDVLQNLVEVGVPGIMWDGIKFFIKFRTKFYGTESFHLSSNLQIKNPEQDGEEFETADGENLFFDYNIDPNQNVLASYVTGIHYDTLLKLSKEWYRTNNATGVAYDSNEGIIQAVLKVLDTFFDGQASLNYIDSLLVNWSNEPYIRGTYSSADAAYWDHGTMPNFHNKVWLAGEAFPFYETDSGFVYGAFDSGKAAAIQMIDTF